MPAPAGRAAPAGASAAPPAAAPSRAVVAPASADPAGLVDVWRAGAVGGPPRYATARGARSGRRACVAAAAAGARRRRPGARGPAVDAAAPHTTRTRNTRTAEETHP
ncbi:hypothetical protein [Streptomyces sp. NPDC006463]|uniref:hypothetical protein n=1 Tax=Streptomyces sp. NPDC006463 TaxID=3364746 RepID=UPI0036B005C9